MDRPCLPCTEGRNQQGYRRVWHDGRAIMAHRLAWERANGRALLPWPQETVDHLCHNEDATCPGHDDCPHRACIEPTHLEAVDLPTNWSRGRQGAPAMRRAHTHCPAGHPYSGDNLTVRKDGARKCRTCHREREAARRAAAR